MKKSIEESIIDLIKTVLDELNFGPVNDDEICLGLAKDSRFGELSTNIALRLSRQLKRKPADIASDITGAINKALSNSGISEDIRESRQEAGFINFYFSENYFHARLKQIILKAKDFAKENIGKNKKVLLEFVSANPTGPLSAAHARQAVVGDVLGNVLDYLGYCVSREYYLNDEGNQINILGDSVNLRLKELKGEKIELPENYYQGDYIYDIAKAAYSLREGFALPFGEASLSPSGRLRSSRQSIVNGLGDYAADYILKIIKKELDDFGVKFDNWYSQKKLGESGNIEKTLKLLEKNGYIYKQDGATWFKSTQFGDDKDRVVIKSDGSYTYLAPDIAYHQDKFKRGFLWLINLWGPDHHGYIGRLKAAVSALGKDKGSLSVVIVQLATIFRDGKPVQMSTRRGEYITLREVLDEVGHDAARFFFLMRRTSSHLDFDLDVAKKQSSENPVYYVQYAHARIASILRNSKIKPKAGDELSLLKEKEELALIKKLAQFSYILNICLKTEDPYMLTVYVQEVAEAFHKFYDIHRVLGQDSKLTAARLALIEGTRIVIAAVLDLLGISKPESM